MANIFFERFAELCKAIGGTPNSVAKDLGISSGSITAWKNGTEPRYSTVSKIADHFDTTVDYLLGRTNDPENEDRFGLDISGELRTSAPRKKAPTVFGERSIADAKAAFFDGYGDDLSEEEKDELWEDARIYAKFKAQQKK